MACGTSNQDQSGVSRRIAFSLKSFMTSGGLDGMDTGLDGAPGHKASTTLHNCTRKKGTRN